MVSLMLASFALRPDAASVLFVGNSHTSMNNVPEMVVKLAGSGKKPLKLSARSISVANLEDGAKSPQVMEQIREGGYDFLILQGAMVSSSHKYRYSQDGGIAMAKAGKKAKAKVYLYAEWPRRGWDETDYILQVYGEIQKPSGAQIIPVGKTWEAVRKEFPDAELWHTDGNHALQAGSYIAAWSIYRKITGRKDAAWVPHPDLVPLNRYLQKSH